MQPERSVQVGIHVGRSVRFVVSVPKNTDLVARTGDGSIAVTGVHGKLELRSGDGSVTGTGLEGDVVANTGDGSVKLEGVTGRVDVNTGDGSVRIAGAPTALKAHTGDGSVALSLAAGTAIKEDWEITTGDGGVTVQLPGSVNAELDASTGDGAIDAGDFGLRTDDDSRHDLRGRLGTGGRDAEGAHRRRRHHDLEEASRRRASDRRRPPPRTLRAVPGTCCTRRSAGTAAPPNPKPLDSASCTTA